MRPLVGVRLFFGLLLVCGPLFLLLEHAHLPSHSVQSVAAPANGTGFNASLWRNRTRNETFARKAKRRKIKANPNFNDTSAQKGKRRQRKAKANSDAFVRPPKNKEQAGGPALAGGTSWQRRKRIDTTKTNNAIDGRKHQWGPANGGAQKARAGQNSARKKWWGKPVAGNRSRGERSKRQGANASRNRGKGGATNSRTAKKQRDRSGGRFSGARPPRASNSTDSNSTIAGAPHGAGFLCTKDKTQQPMISVLTSTSASRHKFFRNLLRNFQHQTYPNKELIILGRASPRCAECRAR